MSKHKHKPSSAERKAKRAARKVLRSRYLFNKYLRTIRKSGVVGEEQNALVLFVVATSCILDRPLNVFVKGYSSLGKNWLVRRVLNTFPEEAVLEFTSASQQAWSYGRLDFRHRVVYLQERNEGMGAMDPMRLLISEGKLVRMVPMHKKGGERKTETITAEGPVAAISTTKKNLQIDDETRHMSIWVDPSKEQTRRILKAHVKDAQLKDAEPLSQQELETWHMVHRILRKMIGSVVVFPESFEEIADQVPVHDPRVCFKWPKDLMLAEVGKKRAFLAKRGHLRKDIKSEVAPLKLALA